MEKERKEVKVRLCSWFDEHWYRVCLSNDKIEYYPSTTTKLSILDKPGLTRWYGDIGTREARKRTLDAGDRGSRLHNAFEKMTSGAAIVYQPLQHPNYDGSELAEIKKKYGEIVILEKQDEMLQVWKVQKLFQILNPIFLGREVIVYSEKYKEAGTIDIPLQLKGGKYEGIDRNIIELEEGIYISDYKTGNLYDEAKMQIASYVQMFIERYPKRKKEVKGGLIIHTGAKNRTGIPGLSLIPIPMAEIKKDFADYRHVAAMWGRKHLNDMPRLLDFPSLIAMKKITT